MRNTAHRVGTVLSAVALTVAVGVALATIVVPKAIGAAPYTVLTGSMSPAMEPGALAIVRPVEADAISIGDVITYQIAPGEPEVVTHRVVGVNASSTGRTFITQGDANRTPDADPVIPAQIRGTVVYSVPWMGHVNSAINSTARSSLLVIGAAGLIGYGLWQVVAGARSRRTRRTAVT